MLMFHQHLSNVASEKNIGFSTTFQKKDVSLKTHRDCLINMQNQLMKHLNHHYSCQHLQVTILSLSLGGLGGAITTFEQEFFFEN